MNPYRVRIEVDIVADDRSHAVARAEELYDSLAAGRPWVSDVLPDGIESREWARGGADHA